MNIPSNATLEKIYGESTVSGARYASLAENFEKEFHSTEMDFFTAPGRTRSLLQASPLIPSELQQQPITM